MIFTYLFSRDYYNFQIDLKFLPKYAHQNKNSIIFTAINIVSRYAYVYPMKAKSANEMLEILNKLLHNALMVNNLTYDKERDLLINYSINFVKITILNLILLKLTLIN